MHKWARIIIIGMRLIRQDCNIGIYIYLDSFTNQKSYLKSQNSWEYIFSYQIYVILFQGTSWRKFFTLNQYIKIQYLLEALKV